ncbi:MAG: glycoside hydrolase family 3 C-terminal domain-containing protein [Candidatus Marinimicrobia bacterium]|nr:glycoside hydrolase family 3 C-terminal domain-containing protein [Candidatus Neomarinimicrobiota bacterium]
MNIKILHILTILVLILSTSCYPPNSKSVETYVENIEREVESILAQMTLEEKVDLLGGKGFKTSKNDRLGIPQLIMTDGPLGPNSNGPSTNYSAMINLAASFDTDLMHRVAINIGQETRIKDRNMLLGPCINIARAPHGGRTFEGFGEDPYLVSRMAVEFVKGVESQGVATCTKHFVANNQEWNRFDVDVRVSERALHEIYFPAFKAAVIEADGSTIMAAYNQILGDYSTESKYTLTDILKNEWGFTGVAVSDWGGARTTVKMANSGLDLEMPTGIHYNEKLIKAVNDGLVTQEIVDDKVRRILRVMMKKGLFNKLNNIFAQDTSNTPERRALALETAQKSIVLLKNKDHFLPLDASKIKSIAVIGPNGNVAQMHGGGSGSLTGHYGISPLEGLLNKVGDSISVTFARGVVQESKDLPIAGPEHFLLPDGQPGVYAEYFNNREQEGEPVYTCVENDINFDWGFGGDKGGPGSPKPGVVNLEKWSARWTGKFVSPGEGWYEFGLRSDNGVRMYLDGKKVLDYWVDSKPGQFKIIRYNFEADRIYDLQVDFYENIGSCRCRMGFAPFDYGNKLDDAIKVATNADVVVLCLGLNMFMEGEAVDRDELGLPVDQLALLNAVITANPNVVVVLNNATPILMNDWLEKVPAVADALYPGQEGGNALSDVLFGDVNPSGKLPLTFPKFWKDTPIKDTYPGVKAYSEYTEGIFVGYRHYDKYAIEPEYAFGHGLSYTTFEYNNIEIDNVRANPGGQTYIVSVTVKNTGKVFGEEVVQLYIRDIHSSVERENKALKGFRRVALEPGESKTVSMNLTTEALSFFHPDKKKWIIEPGEFEALVGSSSRDIRLSGFFTY